MIDLDGRSILVVGGGSGIGLAAAELALHLGARVAVADVDSACAEAVGALGAAFLACDATDADAVDRAVAAARRLHGGLDGLLMTVGGAHLASIDDFDATAWRQEIEFNLTSVYLVCRAALFVMREQRRGAIVTTSSGYANLPGQDRLGYTAAKAGVVALTRSLAAVGAPYGVRVNCLLPGPTDTPRFRAMNGGEAGVERQRQAMPLGSIPRPIDCANMAIYLLSDAAAQITGQQLHVNGGLIMP